MKKLAVSMAVVLTASILMSSSAFALLKPKSEAKDAPKLSSSTSEKADSKKAETGKDAKSTAKTKVLLTSNSDKSLTVTAPKVAAVKKEKIKVKTAADNGKNITATIYEIKDGDTIVSAAKGRKGSVLIVTYAYDPDTGMYVIDPDKLGSAEIGSFACGYSGDYLYQLNIVDVNDQSEYGMMLGTTSYVRIIPAK